MPKRTPPAPSKPIRVERKPWTAEQQAHIFREGRAPHDLVKTVAGVMWECISYPYPGGGDAWVKIRVPGEPGTLRAVKAYLVHPEGTRCLCHAPAGGEGYYKDPPDRAQWRADEIARWVAAGLTDRP